VRRRPAILAQLRASVRAATFAWLAISGLLVQTLVGAPIATRMTIDAAWNAPIDDGAALCLAHPDDDGAPLPAPPQHRHDHEHCVLCQAAAAPLLAAALAPPSAPVPAATAGFSHRPDAAPEKRPPLAYAPRAPPPNA
jgi:hypothetical protein